MNNTATRDTWTPERIEKLKSLWERGLSSSQIAAQLGNGTTRNAVIGKVSRLKLGKRAPSNVAAVDANKAKRKARQGQPRVPVSQVLRPQAQCIPMELPEDYHAPDVTHLIGILDLTERTCKWPLGDPLEPNFGFCGAEKEPGMQPYCEFHQKRASYRR